MSIIRKSQKIETLDAGTLNELVQKIEIHERVYEGSKSTQQIDIYYKFIGLI